MGLGITRPGHGHGHRPWTKPGLGLDIGLGLDMGLGRSLGLGLDICLDMGLGLVWKPLQLPALRRSPSMIPEIVPGGIL